MQVFPSTNLLGPRNQKAKWRSRSRLVVGETVASHLSFSVERVGTRSLLYLVNFLGDPLKGFYLNGFRSRKSALSSASKRRHVLEPVHRVP